MLPILLTSLKEFTKINQPLIVLLPLMCKRTLIFTCINQERKGQKDLLLMIQIEFLSFNLSTRITKE